MTQTTQPMLKFSVTEIMGYMRCPQLWQLTSLNTYAIEPVMKSPSLDFGTIWHATLAHISKADPNEQASLAYWQSVYKHYSDATLSRTIMHYTAQVGAAPDPVELTKVLAAINVGKYMLDSYYQYWGSPIHANTQLIQVEQALTVQIPGAQYTTPGGLKIPIFLECTIDGALADANGNTYVLERKTFGDHPIAGELERNFQFLCYIWAAQQVFGLSSLRGLAYDGVWKRDHIVKNRTIDDMFLRKLLTRSQTEIDTLAPTLAQVTQSMAAHILDNVPVYRVIPAVGGCRDCRFIFKMQPLCDKIWLDGDTIDDPEPYTGFNMLRKAEYGRREKTDVWMTDANTPT